MPKRDPSIITEEVVDPLKQSVANPLSRYLTNQVGQGVPRYEGRISSDFSERDKESAQSFLDINPNEFFTQNVEAPAVSRFRDELALSKEDFAGRLSGSGRFRSEEESISRFTRDLSTARANFETTLPQQQFAIAQQIKQEQDKEQAAQYQDWLKSLPQYSPQLEQSMKFLNESTSTGTTILSYLDPGQKSSMGSIGAMAGFAIGALLAAPTGGLSLLAGGAIGAALGGAAGGAAGSTELGRIV